MRINLFSGPGSGKSTVAATLFGELKKQHYNIELISEYMKQWAYLKRVPKSFDQCYIFGKQLHAEDLLIQSGTEHLITDSPILMQIAYSKRYNFVCWKSLLDIGLAFEQKYPSINIFLDRSLIPYKSLGRYENEQEASEMDTRIKDFLNTYSPNYKIFNTADTSGMLDFIKSNFTTT